MEPSGPLRVVFLGNDRWSVPSLEALAASGHSVVLVVTRVPRPAGRGAGLTPTAVADAARRLGLPLIEVETVKGGSGVDAITEARPDVLAVVAFGEILPAEVLALPKLAPVNLHFSLLPKLRGANPVRAALLEGLELTGVTTMVMDEGLDTGPLLLQREARVREDDDSGSLGDRLASIGAELLVETLEGLAAKSLEAGPQDEGRASYAPKLGPDARWLDLGQDASAIVRRVRALSPSPGASMRFRGQPLKVLRARADPAPGAAGEVVAIDKEGFLVGAGRGCLRPVEVAPAGRRRMSAAEFVRGYRPSVGERLD